MVLLLLFLFIALFVSFLCSIAEAVLLSLPISFLNSKTSDPKNGAEAMLLLKKDIDKPLSAILSMNTVAHTVGAAGVGAQANLVFGDAYFGLVSAVLTILILVFSEIIPKTIGANYSRELMKPMVVVIGGMIFLTYPLVKFSALITNMLSRDQKHTVSREEVSALATLGTKEGVFIEQENKIIQNLVRLKSIKVSQIMTPRVVVVIANEEMSLQEFLQNKDFLHYSRIPVFSESRENITGYVFRSVVFEHLAEDKFDLTLSDIKRNIITFPKSVTLFNAWDEMLAKREHISLIVDEYGGMEGITTLEDIIESLLGFEIVDEKDRVVDMQKFALDRWKQKKKKYDLLK